MADPMSFRLVAEPLPVRIVQVGAVGLSAWLAGSIATFSFTVIPSISPAPAPVKTKQWAAAYRIGASVAPVLAALSSAQYGWLASRATNPRIQRLYTLAAVLIPAIVPWTLLVMKRTNGALFAKEKKLAEAGEATASEAEEREVQELLGKWKVLNYVRAGLAGLGALAGLVALVEG